MANREKKISLGGKKQAPASPVPPPTTTTTAPTEDNVTPSNDEAPKLTPIKNTKLGRKIKKPVTKKIIKQTLTFKPKNKPGRPKKITTLLNNQTKPIEVKKVRIRNGVNKKAGLIRKMKDIKEEEGPPELEPIFPIENEKKTKKRIKKDEDAQSDASEISLKNTPKARTAKKMKIDSGGETLEEVMQDLKSLIKAEDIKQETEVIPKKKTIVRKQKLDIPRKKTVKKENIENNLVTLHNSNSKIIDMLDLNVNKVKKITKKIRRHSIEKFPLEKNDTSKVQNLNIFSNLPRSISPRAKRGTRQRQSFDILSTKRHSPYATRSDSPARILRNGKHRKLKDFGLLDGIIDNEYRRRRRLCSDYSGSEISISKLSGYESDSSFSDMASVGNAENAERECDTKIEIKKEILDNVNNSDQQENLNINSNIPLKIKKSLSTEDSTNGSIEDNFMDTNSNLCSESKEETNSNTKVINPLYKPSSKVPEKSIILDIMKHNFNENAELSEEIGNDKDDLKTNNDVDVVELSNVTTDKCDENNLQDECLQANKEVSNEILPDTAEEEEEEVNGEIPEENHDDDKMEVCDNLENIDNSTENIVEKQSESELTENEEVPLQETEKNVDESLEQNEKIGDVQEDLVFKEHILQALGLQSLRAAEEAKQKQKEKIMLKNDNYTGTLKTVIKLNRFEKKKGRNPVKMTLQKSKKSTGISKEHEDIRGSEDDVYKIMKENVSSNWKSGAQSSDTAGAPRKSHYSNRSNMDGSSEHTSDGDTNGGEEGPGKALVIPEKASSFSIHPDRLCKDECSYCFGKFGLFDTPCHIAQMKSVERQDKILATEKHLTRDSCLCDACYRHVDRKSNTPSYANKSYKRSALVAPGPKQDHCHVLNCNKVASNILRRKWIIKMRKNICETINIDLDNPGLHSIPICDEHYSALEHLMVCAMCKRRLARNHIHYLGSETNDVNTILNDMGIPVKLGDKPVVCKYCRYFANIALKSPEDLPENSTDFLNEYKKRLLHFHNVEPMDEAEAEEPIPVPTKDKESNKKKKKPKNQLNENNSHYESENASDQTFVPSADSRPDSPSDYVVDYQTLIPNIALECGSGSEGKKDQPKKCTAILKKITKPESVKEAVEISKSLKVKNKSDIAVQRLGSNPSISVRQLFPGEEELSLQANIDFNNVKEKTPEGWEKCTSTIQFDNETKLLWQELQKPYGNQSSFLRHLILLEKYFRNGDLVLSSHASNNSINYSESVQNRLKAYDNIPSNAGPTQPLTMLPFNKVKKSTSGIITSKDHTPTLSMVNAANIPKSTPITLTQINNTTIMSTPKQKTPGLPPGLISLHPGTNRPIAPLQKVAAPQPHKIKFPITKNWRPNLIPIDPNKKTDKKSGLVQVISGGKAYHITVEDYKKMCAIKRTFDLRQKRLQEANQKSNSNTQSLLKTMAPKKGLTITKTATVTTTTTAKPTDQVPAETETENCLEKLDKQVEKLEMKLNESKSVMILPKIPKSLTVIPQSVPRKPSRPATPVLQITPKPKPSTSKS